MELTPFNRSVVNGVRKDVLDFVKEHSIDLEKTPEKLKARNKLVVCKTFHGAGLVVPFDKESDTGYRPLLETDAALKKILAKLETNGKATTKPPIEAVKAALQPIITMATIGKGTTVRLYCDHPSIEVSLCFQLWTSLTLARPSNWGWTCSATAAPNCTTWPSNCSSWATRSCSGHTLLPC